MSLLNTKNEMRRKFKEVFLEYVGTKQTADEVTDGEIRDLLDEHQITLKFDTTVLACIRELEGRIGVKYRVRLQRVSKYGYKILSGFKQVELAKRETTQGVVRRFKKGYQRTSASDPLLMTRDERKLRAEQLAALGQITQIAESMASTNLVGSKQLSSLFSQANSEVKRLEEFRKSLVED